MSRRINKKGVRDNLSRKKYWSRFWCSRASSSLSRVRINERGAINMAEKDWCCWTGNKIAIASFQCKKQKFVTKNWSFIRTLKRIGGGPINSKLKKLRKTKETSNITWLETCEIGDFKTVKRSN